MEERAQVAVEYLLTVLFAVLLIIAVTVIAFSVTTISNTAETKVINIKNDAIQTLLS